MAKHIFKYQDKAAYDAATDRPTDSSVASLVGHKGKYDGVNVITDTSHPEAGDAVFFDTLTLKRVLVKHGTLKRALINSARYFDCHHTVVGTIMGKVVVVANSQLPAEMYAGPDEWTVSGFDMTTAGSCSLQAKYYSASGNDVKTIPLEWQANADIATLVTELNNLAGFKSYCKAFKVDNSTIGITVSGYNSGQGIAVLEGDVVATRTHLGYQNTFYPESPHGTQIVRQNNAVDGSGFVCFDTFYNYYQNSGADSTQTLGGSTIKRTAFNETTNPDLYEQFGGDYDAYMAAQFELIKAKYPIAKYGMVDLAFGDEETARLGVVSHERFDGAEIFDFPNAHSALLNGVTLEGFETGFEPGTGHLGGLAEAYLLYTQIKKNNTDVINVTISADGGTPVSYTTTTRLAFQSHASYAWFFRGSNGNLNGGTVRVDAYYARVFRAFDVDKF